MRRARHFLRRVGVATWVAVATLVLATGASTALLASTAEVRFERDISRIVYNDNLELLESVRREVGVVDDTLAQLRAEAPAAPGARPYLVVSVAENRLWFRQGDSVLFTAAVATGSGRTLLQGAGPGGARWTFETPRGRLVVREKEEAPVWVPPDWHYVEAARKRGLGILRLYRGQRVPLREGGVLTVRGNDVVREHADGRVLPYRVQDGREIVADGNIVIPPFGTNQRKYAAVLGTRRLKLGDGYALHGTNRPETIGRSVSHGCVRLRNADIEALYEMVPMGTPVYIY